MQMTLGERNSRQSFYHYLPVNDPAMQWGSYFTGAGRSVILPGQPYPPRERPSLYDCEWRHGQTLPEFAIILITGGRGVFESRQSGQTPIESGSVLVLFPGVWRRYRPDPKTGWTERWLSFNSEIPRQLVRLHLLSSENPLRKVAHADRQVRLRRQRRRTVDLCVGQRLGAPGLWTVAGQLCGTAGPDGKHVERLQLC